MVVDLVTVILQFGGGREELSKVNACVGATVVDTRVDQSLELMSEFRSRESESHALDGPPRVSGAVMDRGIGLPSD